MSGFGWEYHLPGGGIGAYAFAAVVSGQSLVVTGVMVMVLIYGFEISNQWGI